MSSTKTLYTPEDCSEVLFSARHLLLDCDGVLWQKGGLQIIPGAMESLNALEQAGKTISFLTNRSAYAPQHYVNILSSNGYTATTDQIFCTPSLAATYLADEEVLPKGKAVLSLGRRGMDDTLVDAGYKVYNSGEVVPTDQASVSTCPVFAPENSEEIGAVVVGSVLSTWGYIGSNMYPKTLEFLKSHPDVPLILLSGEGVFEQGENGERVVKEKHTLFTEAKRVPVLLGKPEKLFMEMMKKTMEIEPERTLMVGDSIDTDVKFGNSNEIRTLLLNSGGEVYTEPFADVAPTYFANSLPEFVGKGLNHEGTIEMLPQTDEFIQDFRDGWVKFQVERAAKKGAGPMNVAEFAERLAKNKGKKV